MNRRTFIRTAIGGVAAACGVGALAVQAGDEPLYNIVIDPDMLDDEGYGWFMLDGKNVYAPDGEIAARFPDAVRELPLLCNDGKIRPASETNQTGRVTIELNNIGVSK